MLPCRLCCLSHQHWEACVLEDSRVLLHCVIPVCACLHMQEPDTRSLRVLSLQQALMYALDTERSMS